MSRPDLSVDGLTVRFGGLVALDAVNFQLSAGEFVGLIGPNGSGKTTSIGKLALMYKNQGRDVLMAAGDTFRAAAIEQLTVWSERAGVEIVAGQQGGDSAATIYDSIRRARARGHDLLLVDTAGRFA